MWGKENENEGEVASADNSLGNFKNFKNFKKYQRNKAARGGGCRVASWEVIISGEMWRT